MHDAETPAERPYRVDVMGLGSRPRWEARASFRLRHDAEAYYDELYDQGLEVRLVEELPAERREKLVFQGKRPARKTVA